MSEKSTGGQFLLVGWPGDCYFDPVMKKNSSKVIICLGLIGFISAIVTPAAQAARNAQNGSKIVNLTVAPKPVTSRM
jgi:hypothetical protein